MLTHKYLGNKTRNVTKLRKRYGLTVEVNRVTYYIINTAKIITAFILKFIYSGNKVSK